MADTAQSMAAQINEIATNSTLYEDVSKGAFELYRQMTDWEGWKRTLNEILEK